MYSLQVKILMILLPATMLTGVAVFLGFEYLGYQTTLEKLREEGNTTIQAHASILAEPVWNLDIKRVDTYLQSIVASNLVVGAEVTDVKNLVFSQAGVRGELNAKVLSVEKPLIYRFGRDTELVGTLILHLDKSLVFKQFRSNLSRDALQVVSILIAVAVVLSITVKRAIGVPISMLTRFIRRTPEEQFRQPLEWQQQDQLGELIHAFNKMRLEEFRISHERDDYESQLLDIQKTLEKRVAEQTLTLRDQNRELQQHRQQLEVRVAERTRELEKAVAEAKKANQVKSEFLANMSHELRTPMHAIISFASMGKTKAEAAATEKMHKYFSRIHTSGNNLLMMLNDLLDLAKLEAGKMLVDRGMHDLQDTLDCVQAEFSALLNEKNLSLDIATDPAAQCVWCDADRLLQVMRNLVSNAAKFTPAGKSISIEVSANRIMLNKDGRMLDMPAALIQIIDQGVGVPDSELDAIFEKFIQSTSNKPGSGGTGLGLAICREIIEEHDGKIWAEHNPEGGTIINVLIPREDPEASTQFEASMAG